MHVIQQAAHWALAAFMSVLVYVVCLISGAFLLLKLAGLSVGVPPPADFRPQFGADFSLFANIVLVVPPAAATFVGTMTTPFAQRGLAAVVFAVLVFAAETSMVHTHAHAGLNITGLLETAASCALPAGLVVVWWRRQTERIAGR